MLQGPVGGLLTPTCPSLMLPCCTLAQPEMNPISWYLQWSGKIQPLILVVQTNKSFFSKNPLPSLTGTTSNGFIRSAILTNRPHLSTVTPSMQGQCEGQAMANSLTPALGSLPTPFLQRGEGV